MIGIIIEIKESILNNNIAEENGGAIYFSTIDIDYTLKNQIIISDSKFQNNVARIGAGVYSPWTSLSINEKSNVTFEGNNAYKYGDDFIN